MDMPDIVTCWWVILWFHLPTLIAFVLLLTIREATLAPCGKTGEWCLEWLLSSSSNRLSKPYWNSLPCIAKSTLANFKCSKSLVSPKLAVWFLISPDISQQDLCPCTRSCCLSPFWCGWIGMGIWGRFKKPWTCWAFEQPMNDLIAVIKACAWPHVATWAKGPWSRGRETASEVKILSPLEAIRLSPMVDPTAP